MYVPVKQLGNALFVSGQAPLVNGEPAYTGKVGEERTLEKAQKAAEICTINMLAAVKEYLGDLDRVVNVVNFKLLLTVKLDLLNNILL
ncbi:RidA family protein [Clostridium botulinum]|nr:RidA family protein [Clostridium botulinum]